MQNGEVLVATAGHQKLMRRVVKSQSRRFYVNIASCNMSSECMKKIHSQLFVVLLLVTGCKNIVVQSESEVLLLRHPHLKEQYVRLEPTSIYMMRQQLFMRGNQYKMQINLIREIAPTNTNLVLHMEKVANAIFEGDRFPIEILRREQEKWGGQIFLFELTDGNQGYILIRDGEIKVRTPLTQGME